MQADSRHLKVIIPVIIFITKCVKQMPKDEPNWINLPGLNIAIDFGKGYHQYIVEKGSHPPSDTNIIDVDGSRMDSTTSHLTEVMHERKAGRLYERMTFKPSEDELRRAYLDTCLYVNGMEREQSNDATNGERKPMSSSTHHNRQLIDPWEDLPGLIY